MNATTLTPAYKAVMLHFVCAMLLLLMFSSSSLAQTSRFSTLYLEKKMTLQANALSFPRPACVNKYGNCAARNRLFYTDGVQSWDRNYHLSAYDGTISFSDSSVQNRYAALIQDRGLRRLAVR